ncbi:MAG: alcohol dehydrogenase catalytic domain-containing protein, partial [Rhodospirillales bacterium]|nr:alcohol dehydrogenase catalytic domain-containing protein [Rhodospirillales bacterium]
MKAVVIHGAHDLRVEEADVPGVGAHEVKLRIRAGGICGSDLHYYHDGGFGTVRVREPMILGHEIAGEVIEIGSAVRTLAPG